MARDTRSVEDRSEASNEIGQEEGKEQVFRYVFLIVFIPYYVISELTAKMGFKKRPWENQTMLKNRVLRSNEQELDDELIKAIDFVISIF